MAQSNSVKQLESDGFFPEEDAVEAEESKEVIAENGSDHTDLLTEFVMLMKREKTSLVRNPAPMIINVCITAFLSIVFGVIFFGVGREDRKEFLVSRLCGVCVTGRGILFRSWLSSKGCARSTGRIGQHSDLHHDGAVADGPCDLFVRANAVSTRIRNQPLHHCYILFVPPLDRGTAIPLCCLCPGKRLQLIGFPFASTLSHITLLRRP